MSHWANSIIDDSRVMTLIAQPAYFHNVFWAPNAGRQACTADPEGLGVWALLHARVSPGALDTGLALPTILGSVNRKNRIR